MRTLTGRIILVMMCLAVVVTAAFALTTENTYAAHKHSMTYHKAVSATCTKAGNTKYYYCKGCKKYFRNASGTKTIKKNSWVKRALGHKLKYLKSEAKSTCTTKGHPAKCYKCSRCGKLFKDSKAKKTVSEYKLAAHKLKKYDAVPATATTAGNTTYWQCTVCGKYFGDSTGSTEISYGTWVAPAQSGDNGGNISNFHAWDNGTVTTPATCTADGVMTYRCKDTGCDASYIKRIPALGHNYVNNICTRCHAEKDCLPVR